VVDDTCLLVGKCSVHIRILIESFVFSSDRILSTARETTLFVIKASKETAQMAWWNYEIHQWINRRSNARVLNGLSPRSAACAEYFSHLTKTNGVCQSVLFRSTSMHAGGTASEFPYITWPPVDCIIDGCIRRAQNAVWPDSHKFLYRWLGRSSEQEQITAFSDGAARRGEAACTDRGFLTARSVELSTLVNRRHSLRLCQSHGRIQDLRLLAPRK